MNMFKSETSMDTNSSLLGRRSTGMNIIIIIVLVRALT